MLPVLTHPSVVFLNLSNPPAAEMTQEETKEPSVIANEMSPALQMGHPRQVTTQPKYLEDYAVQGRGVLCTELGVCVPCIMQMATLGACCLLSLDHTNPGMGNILTGRPLNEFW